MLIMDMNFITLNKERKDDMDKMEGCEVLPSIDVFNCCSKWYDKKTFEHAKRVAKYAKELAKSCIFDDIHSLDEVELIYYLGLAHDLYEDTDAPKSIYFPTRMEDNLLLLTKSKIEDYITYIKRIKEKAMRDRWYLPAYIVKLADIHDHFAQSETLTDRLKEKYVAAMPYFI